MDQNQNLNNDQTKPNESLYRERLRAALTRLSRNMRLRLNLPFFSYEISAEDLLDHSTVDQRLQRLSSIKTDLQASILAIEELEREGFKKKQEVDELREVVQRLNEEKRTTETLLSVPEENFARVLSRAITKGQWRGRIEGIIIGLTTGFLSSFLVWYFTKP